MGKVTLQEVLSGGPVRAMIDAEIARQVDGALAGRVKTIALSEARRHVARLGSCASSVALAESVQSRREADFRTEAVRRWNALAGTPRVAAKSTALQLCESLSGPRPPVPAQPAWAAHMARRGVSQVTIAALGGALVEAPADAEDKRDGGADEATEDMPMVHCVRCSKKVKPTADKRCPRCSTDLVTAIAMTAANSRHPLTPKGNAVGGGR